MRTSLNWLAIRSNAAIRPCHQAEPEVGRAGVRAGSAWATLTAKTPSFESLAVLGEMHCVRPDSAGLALRPPPSIMLAAFLGDGGLGPRQLPGPATLEPKLHRYHVTAGLACASPATEDDAWATLTAKTAVVRSLAVLAILA